MNRLWHAFNLAVARRLMLLALLLSLSVGVLVPIYTDEIAWRFELSRFVQDGGVDRLVGESCGANTIMVPPMFMWPVRLFSSGVTAIVDDPLGIRIAGVVAAIVAVFMIRALTRRVAPSDRQRDANELFAYSTLGLGVLPFLLVWSRPEQPLLLAVLGASLIGLAPSDTIRKSLHIWRVGRIVALALIALSYHPKGLFYLPAFAVFVVLAKPVGREIAPRMFGLTIMVAAGLIAYRYWSHHLACPADAMLAAKLGKQSAAVLLVNGGWHGVLGVLPRVMQGVLPLGYLGSTLPLPPFMSYWLPSPRLPVAVIIAWVIVCGFAWSIVVGVGIFAAFSAARAPRRSHQLLLGSGAIVLCACVLAASQLVKNSYESALYVPLMAIAIVLLASASNKRSAWQETMIRALAGLSLASQAALVLTFIPLLTPLLHSGGYIAGQPYSFSSFRYPRAAIAQAGAQCGLGPGSQAKRIVVDDLTYLTYAKSNMPLHHMGVIGQWRGSIPDPLAWMRAHGSAGAVLACRELPEAMRRLATASGPYCCLATR